MSVPHLAGLDPFADVGPVVFAQAVDLHVGGAPALVRRVGESLGFDAEVFGELLGVGETFHGTSSGMCSDAVGKRRSPSVHRGSYLLAAALLDPAVPAGDGEHRGVGAEEDVLSLQVLLVATSHRLVHPDAVREGP